MPKSKEDILILIVLGLMVLSGCTQQQTKYVCSDGTSVSNPSFCQQQETKSCREIQTPYSAQECTTRAWKYSINDLGTSFGCAGSICNTVCTIEVYNMENKGYTFTVETSFVSVGGGGVVKTETGANWINPNSKQIFRFYYAEQGNGQTVICRYTISNDIDNDPGFNVKECETITKYRTETRCD